MSLPKIPLLPLNSFVAFRLAVIGNVPSNSVHSLQTTITLVQGIANGTGSQSRHPHKSSQSTAFDDPQAWCMMYEMKSCTARWKLLSRASVQFDWMRAENRLVFCRYVLPYASERRLAAAHADESIYLHPATRRIIWWAPRGNWDELR